MSILSNKRIIALLAFSLLVGIVNAEKLPDAEYQKEIDRISALDAAEEVQKNINENRYQLYVSHNRGGTLMPGIGIEAVKQLSSLCEKVVMQYAGDVVYSPTHLKYMALYFDYATAYNKQMKSFCTK